MDLARFGNMSSPEELEAITAARSAATEAITASRARQRLIVAGPGTGKTFAFKHALQAVGNGGLALTFINALVRELERELSPANMVHTFHGFCKHLLHKHPVEGVSKEFHYYPPLLRILSNDHRVLGRLNCRLEDLEAAFHDLDESTGLIGESLRLGGYYDAVCHTDLVYRVLRHFEGNSETVPIYPLVVVDEYQDFNRLETRFIERVASKSPVLIAGDDDQALYDFKRATPEYIRSLARDQDFQRFDLPFSSRCTKVIVDAVNNVIREACRRGKLNGRIEKPYECYLPEKATDSRVYPAIVHASCSVERKGTSYIGRYVLEQIDLVPREHIDESHRGRYPTALVIGRTHFLRPVYEVIRERHPSAILRVGNAPDVEILDGYRILARRPESRLGWRIVLETRGFECWEEKVGQCLERGEEISGILPVDFKGQHLKNVESLRRLLDGQSLDPGLAEKLEAECGVSIDEIERRRVQDEDADAEEDRGERIVGGPTIVCTSLLGAKGLSAAHVFIVGFNDAVFPGDPREVTDHEICCLIVGLSRTRKQCHVVSCRN